MKLVPCLSLTQCRIYRHIIFIVQRLYYQEGAKSICIEIPVTLSILTVLVFVDLVLLDVNLFNLTNPLHS